MGVGLAGTGAAALAAGLLVMGGNTPALAGATGDTTAPHVAFTPALPPVQGSVLTDTGPRSGVRREARWRVTDTGSGVCSSSAAVTLDGAPVASTSGADRVTFTGSPFPNGRTGRYVVTVTAKDCAGNAGQTSIAYFLSNDSLGQSDGSSFSPNWRTVSCTSCSGGGAVTTSKAGAGVLTGGGGRAFGFVGRVGPLGGIADVYVDGRHVVIDTKRATTADRVVLFATRFSASSNGQVNVRVRSGSITFDAVVIDAQAFG